MTGYSLLGHGLEMAQASGGFVFTCRMPASPSSPVRRNMRTNGLFPAAQATTVFTLASAFNLTPASHETAQMLLFDPQTSGGLLLAVPQDRIDAFLSDAFTQNISAWEIGSVYPGTGITVVA